MWRIWDAEDTDPRDGAVMWPSHLSNSQMLNNIFFCIFCWRTLPITWLLVHSQKVTVLGFVLVNSSETAPQLTFSYLSYWTRFCPSSVCFPQLPQHLQSSQAWLPLGTAGSYLTCQSRRSKQPDHHKALCTIIPITSGKLGISFWWLQMASSHLMHSQRAIQLPALKQFQLPVL